MKTRAPYPLAGFKSTWGVWLLVLVLAVLFWRSFIPAYVHFSNDGPLGQQMTAGSQLPGTFTGAWNDLNGVGIKGGAAPLCLNILVRWILGPVGFAKFLAPLALLTLGLGAWVFFRQLRLGRLAETLGALAVMLNSTFFSAACWGVATQELAIGMTFFAMALVSSIQPSTPPLQRWLRIALAGFAVGLNVMEGADIGALLSMFFAAFVVYQTLMTSEGGLVLRIGRGVGRVIVVALFAGLISVYAISNLIGTQIKGIAGTRPDERTKEQQWDWATQWSMPKRETLGLFMPGVFGYRMDSPDGGNYWGGVGREPSWDRWHAQGQQGEPPAGIMRFSGGGNYSGVLVVLLALWAAMQSFRTKESVFTSQERKLVWFWVAAVPIALLLAYGRFAPFYQLVYALPYFSTIRNPAKFLTFFSFAVAVLFAYGIHGLSRLYLEPVLAGVTKQAGRTSGWWAHLDPFAKRWIFGSAGAVILSLLGWLIYSRSRQSLEAYMELVGLGSLAPQIVDFSIRQVGWFILFLGAGVVVITLIFSGALAGKRARWAGVMLGAVLLADLGRANMPWVVHWDYKEKYATNPIIDLLRNEPFEHRVAVLPLQFPPQFALFDQIYRIEWAQHHFPYYNIQSLDIIQMPRVPADIAAFESTLTFRGSPETVHLLTRRWALTNTRYLLGPAGYLDVLNAQIDPALRRFRIATAFDIVAKPGVTDPTRLTELTASPSPNGAYALFEFTGALSRAKLYTDWQTPLEDQTAVNDLARRSLNENDLASLKQLGTNDFLTLKKLASPSFDPAQTVLLASPIPAPTNAGTAKTPGTVKFTSYASKDIKLKAECEAPSILLLNDKHDPSWQVRVDGKPAELLRCNFIMRGVFLSPGSHEVEFRFKPPIGPLYINLAGVFLCLLISAYLAVSGKPAGPTPPSENQGNQPAQARTGRNARA